MEQGFIEIILFVCLFIFHFYGGCLLSGINNVFDVKSTHRWVEMGWAHTLRLFDILLGTGDFRQ